MTTLLRALQPALQSLRQQTRALAVRAGLGNGAGAAARHTAGKPSAEMRHRTESALDSIRTPKAPKRERTYRPLSWRVVRGDLVQVLGGPPVDIGKRGRVLEVVRRSNRVVVENVNFVRKYVRADSSGESSRKSVLRTEAPLHKSNVAVVCPDTGLPTRVGIRWLEDGTRVRVSKRSGSIIPRPTILRERRTPVPSDARGGRGGARTTSRDEALRETRDAEAELGSL